MPTSRSVKRSTPSSKADSSPRFSSTAARQGTLPLWEYREYLTSLARREIGRDLRSKGDPADIVQETFLDAHRDIDAYHGSTEGEFRAWLRSILRNNARTFRRRYRDVAMRGVSKEIPLESLGAE
ncbi:MAG: sigma factor, partial [Isosphaeraceae bacterium]